MAQKTEAELKKMLGKDLIQLALDLGVSYGENPTKRQVIEDILDAQAKQSEEPDEVDDSDDELEEDDEELDEADLDDDEEDVIEEKPVSKATKKATATTKKSTAAKVREAAGGETLAAKQVANILQTDAKTLRQFFRSSASTVEAVGSGGRYEFDKADVPQIEKEFKTWREGHAARGSKRGPGKSKQVVEAENIEEVEEIEELEDDELDDELDDDDIELEDDDEADE